MNKKLLQALAVLCLLVSIAAVGYAISRTLAAGKLQGPSGLVVAGNEVWIGVDAELWRADTDGRLLGREPFDAIGLPGPPANLSRHPGGRIVAQVRDDPALYFIEPATRQVVQRLVPQWPEDLARHGGRAINLAFHADGRFAVATGGGHAVALFDPEGRFLARTGADTYQFTNGLWWVDDALWTTDTNRFELKRLHSATLAVEQTVALGGGGNGAYLGTARARPGSGAPMAAMVRFHNGMIAGRVVVLDPGGRETASLEAPRMEPMDLDWLHGDVLVTDAVALTVRRWSATGAERPDFGDAELRSGLAAVADERAALQRCYVVGLAVAAAVFALGMGFAVLAERRPHSGRGAMQSVDLSQLGTVPIGWRKRLKLMAPQAAWAGVLLLALIAEKLPWVTALPKPARLWLLAGIAVLMFAALPFVFRAARKLALRPDAEALVNERALQMLKRSKVLASLLSPGEHPLETLLLVRNRQRWLVLTDRRLLVFESNVFDQTLVADGPWSDVAAVSTERGALGESDRAGRVWRWLSAGWLEIRLRDGTLISGGVQAPTVAARIVERLRAAGAASQAQAPIVPPPKSAPGPLAARAALASALLPGLGQWWQRRRSMALLFFLVWAVFMLVGEIPLLWALAGPRRAVHGLSVLQTALVHLAIAGAAAHDAWRLGPCRR